VRSLFLKIFLWFWLAMLLVSLTLLISGYISESRSSQVRDEKMDRTMTPLIADNFVEIYDTQGKPGLTAFLEHAMEAFPVRCAWRGGSGPHRVSRNSGNLSTGDAQQADGNCASRKPALGWPVAHVE
jgi:hypothetical protein